MFETFLWAPIRDFLPRIPELDVEPSDLQELFHDSREGCSGWVQSWQHNSNNLHVWVGGGVGGVLTYTRCAATSGTCRIRERRNPTAAASHFTPSRRTCRQPPRRNASTAGSARTLRERTTKEGQVGATPFQDPRDSVPTFPPLTASTRRQLPARELRDARPPVLKLVDRLRAAQLKMRAGRRCHPPKTVRAGNFNEPCCSFLPARGAVVVAPCG